MHVIPNYDVQLLRFITGENWPVIMFNAMDGDSSSGHHTGKVLRDQNPAAALFFMLSQVRDVYVTHSSITRTFIYYQRLSPFPLHFS